MGNIYHMFQNPNHRQQLNDMGLRPDTAFGCLLNFVLRPVPAVFAENAALHARLTDPAPLKIGIQIRAGDRVWRAGGSGSGGPRIADYHAFFKCAADLEAAFALPGQQVVWYLVSDSVELRQAAVAEYGSKLVTTINQNIQHVIKGWHGFSGSGGPEVGWVGLGALGGLGYVGPGGGGLARDQRQRRP